MSVTQYIGARYVPMFYTASDNTNSWEAGVQYEALTVVTYLNQSYTSKVPVPASVGNPADNPTYWILTGAYNAQVAQYHQDMLDYETATDARLDLLENRKFIFISDSYGTGEGSEGPVTPFITRCAQALGLTLNLNYWKNAQGGASYHGWNGRPTYSDLLGAVSVPDPNEITDIVVCGGINDAAAGSDLASNISAARAFVVSAKAAYPNATIHSVFVGWTTSISTNLEIVKKSEPAYRYVTTEGGCFVDLRCANHDYINFMTDGSHPKADGAYAIGWALAGYLVNGNPMTGAMQYREVSVAAAGDNTTAFSLREYIDEHNVYLSIGKTTLAWSSGHTFSTDNDITIGTINSNNYINSIANLGMFPIQAMIVGTVGGNSDREIAMCTIAVIGGTVKLHPFFTKTFTQVSGIVLPSQYCGSCPLSWC